MQQTTNNILMIRPVDFNFNHQTAINNHYQKTEDGLDSVNEKAQEEFDLLVEKLQSNGIKLLVLNKNLFNNPPDSFFQITGLHFIPMGT